MNLNVYPQGIQVMQTFLTSNSPPFEQHLDDKPRKKRFLPHSINSSYATINEDATKGTIIVASFLQCLEIEVFMNCTICWKHRQPLT